MKVILEKKDKIKEKTKIIIIKMHRKHISAFPRDGFVLFDSYLFLINVLTDIVFVLRTSRFGLSFNPFYRPNVFLIKSNS